MLVLRTTLVDYYKKFSSRFFFYPSVYIVSPLVRSKAMTEAADEERLCAPVIAHQTSTSFYSYYSLLSWPGGSWRRRLLFTNDLVVTSNEDVSNGRSWDLLNLRFVLLAPVVSIFVLCWSLLCRFVFTICLLTNRHVHRIDLNFYNGFHWKI